MTDIEINELVLQKIAGWVKYPIKAGWLTKAILAGGDELVLWKDPQGKAHTPDHLPNYLNAGESQNLIISLRAEIEEFQIIYEPHHEKEKWTAFIVPSFQPESVKKQRSARVSSTTSGKATCLALLKLYGVIKEKAK
jgi:hypothetical protein